MELYVSVLQEHIISAGYAEHAQLARYLFQILVSVHQTQPLAQFLKVVYATTIL